MENQQLINKATKLRKQVQDAEIKHSLKESVWDNRKKLRSLRYHFVFDMIKDVRDIGIEIAKFNQINNIESKRRIIKKMEIDENGYLVLAEETEAIPTEKEQKAIDLLGVGHMDLGMFCLNF